MELTKERMLEIAKNRKNCEFCFDSEDCDNCEKAKPISHEDLWEFYENVLELLQADAEGRLVELPCRIGDTVYTNTSMTGWYFRDSAKPYAAKVVFIGLNDSGGIINVEFSRGHMMQFRFDEVGKSIFLTHEEAKAALEKMGGTDK